jgi:glucose/arabinose dehydrogenase
MKKAFSLLVFTFSCIAYSQTIAIASFATGFTNPVEITHAGDSRLFVVEQGGRIKILNSNQTVNPTPFLTLTTATISTGGERGLLGLAFHPNYATNGFFYVNYTRTGDGATVIARYTVSANPDIANTTGTVLLTIPQPFANHNGGTLKFGSDGYLYIGMGDGGSAGDPGNRAQNINELLGKMLRIDVNSGVPYGIPAGNPYAGIAGADEIWAIGLRNPWKFSFDRSNGDLWIADVGQGTYEEINRATATESGLNYGWRCYEGNNAFNTAGCAAQATMKSPLGVINQNSGACSITGGYIYRGSLYPSFQGKYFFSDYCLPQIGMMDNLGNVTFSDDFANNNFVTFGENVNGELFIGDINNGIVYRLYDSSLSTAGFDKNNLSIYPNPTNSEVFIQSNTPDFFVIHADIFDLNGKLLLSQKSENQPMHSLNTSHLSAGLYVLKVKTNTGLISAHKLVKI